MDIFSSKLFDKLGKAIGIDEIDEIKKQIIELSLTECQEMLKEKDTRFAQKEQIHNQNMDAKHAELLSEKNRLAQKEQEYSQNLDIEKNRLVRLKEFISSHAKCVGFGCKKKFDSLLHIPYVLTCGHTICSYCFFDIPIITDEENAQYNEYARDANQPRGFFSKIAQMIPLGESQEAFQTRIKAIKLKIEEQKTHLQGFEHIGNCPVCKTPQRGLRYDLLATVNVAKEFSFGKNKRNKKNKKSIKNKKSKRKSIKNKKSKRKSIKNIKKSKNKRKSIKRKSIKRNKK